MVLSWGTPVCKSSGTGNADDEEDDDGDGRGTDVVSILRRQRKQRSRWTNRSVQERESGGTTSQAEGSIGDVDTW